MYLPEEVIVAEILPRLHAKPLFTFKTVSKLYQSIISDPKFAQKYLQRAYSSPESSSSLGLVASLLCPFTSSTASKDHFSNNVKDLTDTIDSDTSYHGDQDDLSSIHLSSVSLNDEPHEILASSNGLILFFAAKDKRARGSLYVSNPLTKQCVEIPVTTPLHNPMTGFATRLVTGDQDAAFLTYKVVAIQRVSYKWDDQYADITVDIFSSDTGSWAASELRCSPKEVIGYGIATQRFAHKGSLHWLGLNTGSVSTYDPYDSPDRFGCIRLPSGNDSSHSYKSLINSGEGEMLKYCELNVCSSGVDRLSVWRLVDSAKGEWCLESQVEFRVPLLLSDWDRGLIVVAPIPWNREVICFMFSTVDNNVIVYNMHARPLVPIELCPWSSPFYAPV